MKEERIIRPPFFEIGPKNYLYGEKLTELAGYAERASRRYEVDIIFTTPYTSIRQIAAQSEHLHIFAPHMDPDPAGRGLANVLPEAIQAAGAEGVMLNHAERPLSLRALYHSILRARQIGLKTIVCADSMAEARAVAQLGPDLIVAEPEELIGTGEACGVDYVQSAVRAVRSIAPQIGVLVGGGIHSGEDVYRVIAAGADATGSSSAIALAPDPERLIDEMIGALRRAWDERQKRQAPRQGSKEGGTHIDLS